MGPLVQVPAVAVEEVEDALEGRVGDADVGVVSLQVVDVEQAAVEEGDPTDERGQIWGSLRLGLSEALVEQPQQEDAVELLEAPVAALVPHSVEAVAEVVEVAVKEALLLDEVDEHHAVEHEGGVPVAVALGGYAVDEVAEGGQLRPEAVVEAPGDLLHVQRGADAGCDIRNANAAGLFLQGEDDRLEALEEGFAALSRVELLLPAGGGLAGLPAWPTAIPCVVCGVVNEDDQVLEGTLGHLALYPAPNRIVRNVSISVGAAPVDDETGLLRDGLEGVFAVVHPNCYRLGLVVVPAQALHEEACEVEAL